MMDQLDSAASSLEASRISEFDPLKELPFDQDAEDAENSGGVFAEGPFGMPDPNAVPEFKGKQVSFTDGETPEERIDALFSQMPTLQHMLFAILKACREPVHDEELAALIDEMKKQHHSVYSPTTFITLLERAGAAMKVDERGISLGEAEQEPLMEVVDGTQYWKVAPAPIVYWCLTDAGAAKLATYQPVERIRECLENEPEYAEIFETVLRMCAVEPGATVKGIGDVIEDEPVLQKPRRFAMYFIDKLERAGGVEWKGSWIITEAGREFLSGLGVLQG